MMRRIAFALLAWGASIAYASESRSHFETRPALLVPGFLQALEHIAANQFTNVSEPEVQFWIEGIRARGIAPEFIANRLAKAKRSHIAQDPFADFSKVNIEIFDDVESERKEGSFPAAIHAYKLDILDDLDGWFNDNIYAYFITTNDDLLWGKVTSIYTGLDQGDSVFFTAEDRGIFGPSGEKIIAKNHTIIDFGLIESDGDDIKNLQKLSDTIVDLALVALTMNNPAAGAAAAQARAEVKNLLHLIIAMDQDDRVVADTLYFTPESFESSLAETSYSEFDRLYEGKRGWSTYAWRIHFRMLK